MIGVRAGLATCLVAVACLSALLGLGPFGAAVAVGSAVVLALAAGRRAVVDHVEVLGPADLVTLARATLACAVAGLVAETFRGR